MDAKAKAELLANTFKDKSTLLEFTVPFDESSVPFESSPMNSLFAIRTRHVAKQLKSINVDTSTGPDHIPAMLLKMCADTLALPLCKVIRTVYFEGTWPEVWQLHWIIPIFKRKSPSDPKNYRGVHLTSILSKIAERIIGNPLIKFLEESGNWCDAQFAFRKGHTVMEALCYACNKWILALHTNKKVGIYCSDIAGAFDRVATHILLKKLYRKGIRTEMLNFLNSYLSPRKATVCVGVNSPN